MNWSYYLLLGMATALVSVILISTGEASAEQVWRSAFVLTALAGIAWISGLDAVRSDEKSSYQKLAAFAEKTEKQLKEAQAKLSTTTQDGYLLQRRENQLLEECDYHLDDVDTALCRVFGESNSANWDEEDREYYTRLRARWPEILKKRFGITVQT